MPLSHAMAARADHNLIYLGVAPGDLPDAPTLPIAWDGDTITVGATSYEGAVAFVYPDGDHLAGYFAATAGREYLLYRYQMFSSRSGMPSSGTMASPTPDLRPACPRAHVYVFVCAWRVHAACDLLHATRGPPVEAEGRGERVALRHRAAPVDGLDL